MKVYLSGKMTGLPELNYPEFARWAKLLRIQGHTVISPSENDNGSQDKSRAFYMRLDTENLLQVEAVALLPGWEDSKGVAYELAIAHELGLSVYAVEDILRNTQEKMLFTVQINVL